MSDEALFAMFNGMCACCLIRPAVCIHHMAGRIDPSDSDLLIPLCNECHTWATNHKKESNIYLPGRRKFALHVMKGDYAPAASVTTSSHQEESKGKGSQA